MKETRSIYFVFLFLFTTLSAVCQQAELKGKLYLEPEYSIGKILPSHSEFPESFAQQSAFLSLGVLQQDSSRNWVKFFNYPQTAIGFAYSDFGNPQVFGQSFNLIPELVFSTGNRHYKTSHIRLGLGASYFTKKYEWPDNIHNNSIGSHYTWTFRLGYYYNWKLSEKVLFNLGASYIHSSNSHVQLPNFGLNTILLNASVQLFQDKPQWEKPHVEVKRKEKLQRFYISMYLGTGWHELGDAAAPKFTPKKLVKSFAIFGSKVFQNSFRLKAGATYRFYQSYYDYIRQHEVDPFVENPVAGASNILLSVGGELLLGHFGAELEAGINIYKPFYSTYSDVFEKNVSGLANTLKAYIPLRLGLKAYAISNEKAPLNNVFIATHINSNLGAADFMSITAGYVRRIAGN